MGDTGDFLDDAYDMGLVDDEGAFDEPDLDFEDGEDEDVLD